MTFFEQLRQRRIVQIAASYLVSGWVATEVVGALVERGILPELIYRLALVLFIGGFAVSVVTGWFHGEKGHQSATPVEIWLLVIIALGTGWFGYRTWESARAAVRARLELAQGGLDLRRVAVLYFRDQSRSRDLAYLADGLTESLIDRLGQVSGLTVISKDGAAQFRDASLSLDSIGSLLSAGILIDGSVERSGSKVKVSLSLVDGDSGAELKRGSVERPADDVLALQDELTDEVVDFLRGALGEEISVREARLGTTNVQAWTAFLRGQRSRRDADESAQRQNLQAFTAQAQQADSFFTLAESLDPRWAAPLAYRAVVASRWGGLSAQDDPVEGRTYLERALALADSSLARDPRYAIAHQIRGTVQYQRWALGLTPDPQTADSVFKDAKDELDQATTLDPQLASAWNTLSVVYSQIPDQVGANLAARRALEADEFLRSAESVLTRLYATSYDLEQFREAIRYCEQGHHRFPDNPTFTECTLWLMAAPRALTPEPDSAWKVMDSHLAMLPEASRPWTRIQDQLLVAGVLARAQMPDSAKAVIARSKAGPDIDPERELLGIEALDWLALDDKKTAVERLRVYLTASPEHRAGWRWTSHWWWRDLQDDPEFRHLIGR